MTDHYAAAERWLERFEAATDPLPTTGDVYRLVYRPALHAGRCTICSLSHILAGDLVGHMPPSWQPGNRNRTAHRDCLDRLIEDIRARAERLARRDPATQGRVKKLTAPPPNECTRSASIPGRHTLHT